MSFASRSRLLAAALPQLGRGWVRPRQAGLRILNYHYIREQDAPAFELQLQFFMQRFEIVSLKDLHAIPSNSPPSLALTFDDGYEKVWRYGVPLLRKYKLPASFFICSDFISDDTTPTAAFRQFYAAMTGQQLFVDTLMTWQQLRQLAAWGFEIGCHTADHPHLRGLDAQALQRQINASKQKLESQLQTAVTGFAIPYGHHQAFDDAAVMHVHAAGFRYCLANLPGNNPPPVLGAPWLKRYSVQPSTPLWQLKFLLG